MSNKELLEEYLSEIDMLLESDYEFDHPRIIDLEQRIDKLMQEGQNA